MPMSASSWRLRAARVLLIDLFFSLRALDGLKDWYIWSRGSTPMAYLINTWKYLRTLASADDGMPTIATTDPSGETMLIDGEVVGRSHIANLLKEILAAYDEVIREQFCLNLSSDYFELPKYKEITEDPANTTPGYSFLHDDRNPFLKVADRLVSLWLGKPSIADRLAYKLDERIYWITGQARALLAAEAQATRLLVAALMISSGAPPRGEEMAAMVVRNVPGGSIRNVLVLKGVLCVTGGYNKTSHNDRRDKVTPRVPIASVQKRLLQHLTYYRPAARSLVQDLGYPPDAIERYQYYLMPGLVHTVTGEHISSLLHEVTSKWFPVALKLRRLRHIFKFVDRSLRDPGNVVLPHWNDEQAGHQSSTANRHYGLTASMLGTASNDRILGCFRSSRSWHKIFGCTVLADILEKHGESVPRPGPSGVGVSTVAVGPDVDTLARRLHGIVTPSLQISIRSSLESEFAQMSALYFPPPLVPPTVPMAVQPSVITHPSHLVKLRRFTKNPDAQFKNITQAAALTHILARQENILLVGATGESAMFPTYRPC